MTTNRRRQSWIRLAIITALATTGGCDSNSASGTGEAPRPNAALKALDYGNLSTDARLARERAVDEFVWHALPDIPDGVSLSKIRSLGKLPLERVRQLDNEYQPGQKIEERTFVFDGLEITGEVVAAKAFRPWHAKITGPGWRVRSGLMVGMSADGIARVLGPPNGVEGESIDYQGESEAARFTIHDGRIAVVEVFVYHE